MTDTKMSRTLSPKLLEVAERAKYPNARFLALAYLIDLSALERAYKGLRKKAAVGADGVTVEQYGESLQDNLQDLHQRMKAGKYRHQPLRRTFIRKEDGSSRPIGISATEDKIVQNALREVLELVYEPIFHERSYGFRPGRRAHDAVRYLQNAGHKGEIKWVLEADITSFFDSVNRQMLQEMLQERVPDGSIKRLVGKCLKVGVLEGEELSWSKDGTTQGSILSPLLGNIYLHHVLDCWFEDQVRPRLQGLAHLVRYADDFVIGFENKLDAERVMAVLPKRLGKFGLKLHPDKTRLVPFQRPPRGGLNRKGPGTFDFVGFTFYWRRVRSGGWGVGVKTRRKSSQRFLRNVYDWCRRHRHWPIAEQHRKLRQKLTGFLAYFGVNGNQDSNASVIYWTKCAWGKWLRRRSDRARRLSWDTFFGPVLRRFPFPGPRVYVNIWDPR
jgi:group II intron reverse transcriptase/maturase